MLPSLSSGPARGLWIEIRLHTNPVHLNGSRAPQGACGLKLISHKFRNDMLRRAPQGACGLKSATFVATGGDPRRAPQGACGLKYHKAAEQMKSHPSGPARGLWIEIWQKHWPRHSRLCRAPQGACGLKSAGEYILEPSAMVGPRKGPVD